MFKSWSSLRVSLEDQVPIELGAHYAVSEASATSTRCSCRSSCRTTSWWWRWIGRGQMGSAPMGSLRILHLFGRDFSGTPVNLCLISLSLSLSTCIYIYIYTYIHICIYVCSKVPRWSARRPYPAASRHGPPTKASARARKMQLLNDFEVTFRWFYARTPLFGSP